MKKFLVLLFVCFLSCVSIYACGGDSGSQINGLYGLNKTELTLSVGNTETLVLNGAEASKVEWETFNQSIATVDGGVVTAISEGVVNVAAVYENEVFICRIVVEQVFETIPVLRIVNAPRRVAVGDTTVILEISFTDGTAVIDGASFEWESDNSSVITVDNSGRLTILNAGTATISVSCTYENAVYTADCLIKVV